MSYPEIINDSGIAYESLHLTDEAGVPVLVALFQAVCAIGREGTVSLLSEQPPVKVEGQWYGEPGVSSLKVEPQLAFMKMATDIVLLGDAYPTVAGGSEGWLGIRVGPVEKIARVVGDRWLMKRSGRQVVTGPEPFDRIPIVYERSFGGWDRRHDDGGRHRCEGRNPVGTGFRDPLLDSDDDVALPNFEAPDAPLMRYGDTPPPVGFGFVPPDWSPRAELAGTYDEVWDRTRKPLLPLDFDRRFFNAASPGLIATGYLAGNEKVVVVGAAPEGRVEFQLPGIVPPTALVELRAGERVMLQSVVDTVVVDMALGTVTLLWRAHLRLRSGPHDVLSLEVAPKAEDPENESDEE